MNSNWSKLPYAALCVLAFGWCIVHGVNTKNIPIGGGGALGFTLLGYYLEKEGM